MSVNFKLFEIKAQKSKKTIFSAYVADEKAYRIITDVTGRFKKKFLKIMRGVYKHTYMNKETEESIEYKIEGDNPLENLQKYANDCNTFSHTTAEISPSNIKHQYTLHFYGVDYNMSKGMEPKAQHRANDFFFELGKISQMKIPANNYLNEKPQEFTTAEAASLKLEMYSTREMVDFKIVFKQLLDDIQSGILSTEVVLGNRYAMYKRLFKEFSKLTRFNNLDTLTIIIDGLDTNLTDFEDIANLAENVYGAVVDGEMIIQSVHDYYRDESLDGLIVDTLNFSQITTWKYPKNNALSKFLHLAKGEKVKLDGWTEGENTRRMKSLEFLRDGFSIPTTSKQELQRAGSTVIDKKLIIGWE
ncbi:MAG: hypothetical protein COA39_006020 [Sulfurimonas sp.]|nr:hypothetical protein [Sulfurimonas sp.]